MNFQSFLSGRKIYKTKFYISSYMPSYVDIFADGYEYSLFFDSFKSQKCYCQSIKSVISNQ